MARKIMVTRTFLGTKVTVLEINVETAEPHNNTYDMPRRYKDNDSLLKAVKEAYETETNKIVHVVAKEETDTLREMTESDFIKYSTISDKKRKHKNPTE